MSELCPNCSEKRSGAPEDPCPRCGYHSGLRGEYLWLYLGGAGLVLGGFALGVASLVIGEPDAGHWSGGLSGWFPLGGMPPSSWPRNLVWIAYVLAGILWTLAGLGITRRRWAALALLGALVAWQIAWTLREIIRLGPGAPVTRTAAAILVLWIGLGALAGRIAVAMARTPPRDVRRLQSGTHSESARD